MTLDEFTAIYTDNPSADAVMEEIRRLYESETKLTEEFASADSERNELKQKLDEANKRYRERFFSGSEPDKNKPSGSSGNPFEKFFKKG